jgi:histidine ammonia-lyase
MLQIENSNISLKDIYFLLNNPGEIKLTDSTKKRITQSYDRVQKMALSKKAVYGINTGFGPLCTTKVSPKETKSLQENLLLSHSVGVGNPISPDLSKLMLICKILSLAKGYSGIRLQVLDRLIYFVQNNLTPLVPEKGSVGASGDLAPLAHLFLPLIGRGFFLEW